MKNTISKIALWAILAALALGLSTLESLIPVTLLLPLPGIKLGLANIVTLFALYKLGTLDALAILVTRCLLGSLFAGTVTALLFSLLGGLCAMGVMACLKHHHRLSLYGISIGGAAAHNSGQILAAVLTLGNAMVVGYLPFLLMVSLFTGSLTGYVVSLLLRAISHLHLTNQID